MTLQLDAASGHHFPFRNAAVQPLARVLRRLLRRTIFLELNEDCSGSLVTVWPSCVYRPRPVFAILLAFRHFPHPPDCHFAGRSRILAGGAIFRVGALQRSIKDIKNP